VGTGAHPTQIDYAATLKAKKANMVKIIDMKINPDQSA
jgi:hypothetical protein